MPRATTTTITMPADWHEVRARGRVVHLMTCAGTGYRDLAEVAQGDPAVIVAAIAYESDDRTDYSIMTLATVRYRLRGLLDHLSSSADDGALGPSERAPVHPTQSLLGPLQA